MALSLGVRVGGDVFIGDDCIKVVKIHGEEEFIVAHHQEDLSGKTYKITAEKALEVLPEVFISAGRGKAGSSKLARLVITAPREIKISRGE